MKRKFTRADVEKKFMDIWGEAWTQKPEIQSTALLYNVEPATWVIDFIVTAKAPATPYVYHSKSLLTERNGNLEPVHEIRPPEGCTSVEEEDEAIRKRYRSGEGDEHADERTDTNTNGRAD